MTRKIVIEREHNLTGALAQIDVLLDGEKIGCVDVAEPTEFEIPDGYHNIGCRTGLGFLGTKSNEVRINDNTDCTLYFKVNLKKGFNGTTFSLYGVKAEDEYGQVVAAYDPRLDPQAAALAQRIAGDFDQNGFFCQYVLSYKHAVNLGVSCEANNIKVMWNKGPEIPRNVPVYKDPIGAFNWIYYKLHRKMSKEERAVMEEMILEELQQHAHLALRNKLFDIRLAKNEVRFNFGW